jgi:hypothetical protein
MASVSSGHVNHIRSGFRCPLEVDRNASPDLPDLLETSFISCHEVIELSYTIPTFRRYEGIILLTVLVCNLCISLSSISGKIPIVECHNDRIRGMFSCDRPRCVLMVKSGNSTGLVCSHVLFYWLVSLLFL